MINVTLYQIKTADGTPSAWHDATEEAYWSTPEKDRRIVYLAPAYYRQDLMHALNKAAELHQQLTLLDEHARGTVWRWQADGHDNLESMGNRMAVLIYASDLRQLLADRPAEQEATVQYYSKVDSCQADGTKDKECICWHDKGTGIYPDAKVGDIYNGVTLSWRKKPAPSARPDVAPRWKGVVRNAAIEEVASRLEDRADVYAYNTPNASAYRRFASIVRTMKKTAPPAVTDESDNAPTQWAYDQACKALNERPTWPAVQELIDATGDLLRAMRRKSYTSGYAIDMTPQERGDISARYVTARDALKLANVPGTNSGHGHVWERPDGRKAKCGGPNRCVECHQDETLQTDSKGR